MPLRTIPLVNDQYYHIFNRGVAKQPIFLQNRDYQRFVERFSYYRFKDLLFSFSKLNQKTPEERKDILDALAIKGNKIIEIIAFALMPNHFHFLLRQNEENGISKFIGDLTNSYVRYFNTKYERVGPLFQAMFKAVRIESDEQLLHLSRYIHLNPLTSYVIKDKNFLKYKWTSLPAYLDTKMEIVNPSIIKDQFAKNDKYLEFVLDQKNYARELKKIEHLLLESS